METTAETVLCFWFDELGPDDWFARDDALDRRIAARFGDVHARAAQCECDGWRTTPRGRLAEIIVLDQFSRNIFRGHPEAFANDAVALALAQEAVARGADADLTPPERAFLYMPYMHSESPVIHDRALRLFDQAGLERELRYERDHKAIIDRFGRYPHRNPILGRDPTPAESAFLEQHGMGF